MTSLDYQWQDMLFAKQFMTHKKWHIDAISQHDTVLDIGLGNQEVSLAIANRAKQMVGVNYRKPSKLNLTNTSVIESSIYDLPIDDGSMNKVILSDVLQVVDDPTRLLNEAKRVLAPNGKILLTVLCQGERRKLKGFLYSTYVKFLQLSNRIETYHIWSVDDVHRLLDDHNLLVDKNEVLLNEDPLCIYMEISKLEADPLRMQL